MKAVMQRGLGHRRGPGSSRRGSLRGHRNPLPFRMKSSRPNRPRRPGVRRTVGRVPRGVKAAGHTGRGCADTPHDGASGMVPMTGFSAEVGRGPGAGGHRAYLRGAVVGSVIIDLDTKARFGEAVAHIIGSVGVEYFSGI